MHFTQSLLVTFPFFSQAFGLAISPRHVLHGRDANSGQATFYGGNVAGGHCSFASYTLPDGVYGTASANWDGSAHCGDCVSVTGPGGQTITAMITDQCPGCGTNHLDLFPDAFAALANPDAGVINVSWDYIDCPISSPLQLINKSGVSAYWFSMQVVNANQEVASLDVSTDGGNTWMSTRRQDYNFFEISSGTGSTSVDVKVTSTSGATVVVNDVQVVSDGSTTAGGNFVGGYSASPASSPSASASVASNTASTPVSTSSTPSSAPSPTSVVTGDDGNDGGDECGA